MTSFENSIRTEIQVMQAQILITRTYGPKDYLLAYDAQLQGYLMALRRCLSETVYRTITEGLVD